MKCPNCDKELTKHTTMESLELTKSILQFAKDNDQELMEKYQKNIEKYYLIGWNQFITNEYNEYVEFGNGYNLILQPEQNN